MRNVFKLIIAFCFITFSSCVDVGRRVEGNGHITSAVRSANVTDRIKLSGSMDVVLSEGPSNIKVEADENLIPYIITDVHDGWLEVRMENGISINTANKMTVYITTPSLAAVKISGSGNVSSSNKFESSGRVDFSVSGSGDINCDINAPEVQASITGSGNIKLGGETKDVNVHITGGGDYEGSNLKAENATVNITGSGDVSLFADATLHVKVTGSGSVKYKGNATVEQKVVGSGSVEKMQ